MHNRGNHSIIMNYALCIDLGVPATPSGFPLYLCSLRKLRSQRMPLQSLTRSTNQRYKKLKNVNFVKHIILICIFAKNQNSIMKLIKYE